ncbi:hypothetical protein ANCCAN_02811 [Ancylostoma caninum]|uniref:Uncharacterized protein n=1 Tax=Ancylostoma caninum TaxID=29170 RepID=A0A368H341_ANCCA|nr:hypothetical protein ANCCAN_02811 [Ancylostoma caninum]
MNLAVLMAMCRMDTVTVAVQMESVLLEYRTLPTRRVRHRRCRPILIHSWVPMDMATEDAEERRFTSGN